MKRRLPLVVAVAKNKFLAIIAELVARKVDVPAGTTIVSRQRQDVVSKARIRTRVWRMRSICTPFQQLFYALLGFPVYPDPRVHEIATAVDENRREDVSVDRVVLPLVVVLL